MIVLSYTLLAIGRTLESVIWLLMILVGVRVVLSWVNPDPMNAIVRTVTVTTEPFLRPLRRIIPPIGGGLDLSPIILFLALSFLNTALVGSLLEYAVLLRTRALP